MREWRNRQTRTVQVRVLEIGWGFNSPLAHQLMRKMIKDKDGENTRLTFSLLPFQLLMP